MNKRLLLAPLMLTLMIYISCGGAGGGGEISGGSSLRVSLRFDEGFCPGGFGSSPRQFQDITSVTISGLSGSETIEESFAVGGLTAQVQIFFPLGPLAITVVGTDANQTVICMGGINTEILPGENAVVIPCALVPGEGIELVCGDGQDNDGDDLTDCADPDCSGDVCSIDGISGVCSLGLCVIQTSPAPTPSVQPTPTTSPIITPEPSPTPGMNENCANGMDDDGDRLIDCADFDCVGQVGPCQAICEFSESTCDDFADNDGDGLIDCADSNCDGVTVGSSPLQEGQPFQCEFSRELTCDDFADNDGDFQFDCQDSDCASDPRCTETGDECLDGQDNDGDQLHDCADPDCRGLFSNCEFPESTCNDNFDNDGDGNSDCQDFDCDGEVCLIHDQAGICSEGVCLLP
ncbi:MAG: hypothetical protein ACT4NX_08855 [Deltaproteobacteria bacterium]